MKNKTIILLDVDGVLNAMPDTSTPPPNWPDWSHLKTEGFDLWTSKAMANEVTNLGEVHWLTTWNDDNMANAAISPLVGIGPFPIASSPSNRLGFGDFLWKPRAVTKYSSDDQDVVWIDDEAYALWNEWNRPKPDNLFICNPNPDTGLSKQDLHSIKVWLKVRAGRD